MMTANFPASRKFKCFFLFALLGTGPFLISCHKDNAFKEVNNSSPALFTSSAVSESNRNLPTGSISMEVWNNNYGNDVDQIALNNTPSLITALTAFEEPANTAENYGTRIRGYITAPSSGKYKFWIAADDAAALWLSNSEASAGKMKIAYTLSWNNPREWTKFASQESPGVTLTEGQKYYIEVLHKQGGGGGNLAVQWMLPDGKIESPIPGNRLSPFSDQSADPAYTSSAAINLDGQHDLTISGKSIAGGAVPLIKLTNCYNIHITGNKLANGSDVGIYLYNCRNITIDDNFFTKVSTGVYADHTQGGIVVNNNQFLNMQGPFPRGQFVQFNNVKGEGSSISNNRGENIIGESYAEDAISLYQSEGSLSSPILINGNWIRGGGPSASGGGIMLGDNGGAYLYASGNILVNPGQFGMAISGGHHLTIVDNSIYGSQQSFTNVGLYVNDIGGWQTSDCKVTNNKVRYYNKDNYQNNAWLSPNSMKPEGWDANNWGAAIDTSILPAVIITKK